MKLDLIVAAVAFSVAGAAFAEVPDYALPAGSSDTMSEAATYRRMDIMGDLTVNQNAIVNVTNACIAGGTVTIDGEKSSLGTPTISTLDVTNNADGVYGKIIVRNGRIDQWNPGDRHNLSLYRYNINTNAADVTGNDGVIDVIDMNAAGIHLYNAYNYSTLTARISVAGLSSIMKLRGYSSNNGTFRQGKFMIDMAEGSELRYDVGNQQAGFNDKNVSVRIVGAGTLTLVGQYNGYDNGNFPLAFRQGAYINHSGDIKLIFDSKWGHIFYLEGDNVIGPNVKRIWAVNANSTIRVAPFAVQTLCGDLDLSTAGSKVVGDGTLILDCSAAARRFVADSPKFYNVRYDKVDHTTTNMLRIVKTGDYEATFVSTNIPNLRVDAGAVRFAEKDCTVQELHIAQDAEVIVDGCTLTLDVNEVVSGLNIRTVNGGQVVNAGGDCVMNGAKINGSLRVKNGKLAYAPLACDAKYWRFTFKGTSDKPAPLHIRNVIFFDDDHKIQSVGNNANYFSCANPVVVYDDTWTDLAAQRVRWRCSSVTNVLATSMPSWCDVGSVYRIGTIWNLNANNFANLTAPVVNRDDPDSYLTLEFRLANTAKPITGYNLTFVWDGKVHADTWDVYASQDGTTWTLVDSRENVEPCRYSSTSYATMDGCDYSAQLQKAGSNAKIEAMLGECFHFNKLAQSGLASTETLQAQVDEDAELDLAAFTEAVPTINGLTVDAEDGGGKISGGKLAMSGTVELLDLDFDEQGAIPFEFAGTADLQNLQNWQVVYQGVVIPGGCVVYDETEKALTLSAELKHITEDGEGNIQGLASGKSLFVKIDKDVTYTNTEALTGDKGLAVVGGGRLVLTKDSADYSGNVYLGTGIIEGGVSNAFGTGTITIVGSTTEPCMVIFGSETADTSYPNDIVVKGDTSVNYPAIKFITVSKKHTELHGSLTAGGYLVIDDSGAAAGQGYELVQFHGSVNAAGQTIEYSTDNAAGWHGKVTAARIYAYRSYPRMGRNEFYNSENEIGMIETFYIQCKAKGENAWGGAMLQGRYGNNEAGRGYFDMGGFNQTVAGLNWVARSDGAYGTEPKMLRNGVNAAVTLTIVGGVAKASTCYNISGTYDEIEGHFHPEGKRLSVVVNASNDDFVQELTNATCTTFGDVTVVNGCLRLTGYTSMTNVPSVEVSGGRLEILGTNECAFASVANLTIGENGRIQVAETAGTPFGGATTSKTALRMASDSRMELADGAEVTVKKLFVNGERFSKGVYTGDSTQAGDGVTYLPQIEGSGRLNVLSGGGLLLLLK